MERQFEEFFRKYGNLNYSPYSGDKDSVGVLFWADMNKIIQTDKDFFDQTDFDYAPEKYKEWLFVKRWRSRLGEETIRKYVEVVKKILYD